MSDLGGTDEDTGRLISWRARNEALFTGVRNASVRGFQYGNNFLGVLQHIHVFGLGNDIDEREIGRLVSKKPEEKHIFQLKSRESMEEMLDELIDESDSVGPCRVYRDYDKDTALTKRWIYPWAAKIEVTRQGSKSDCMGALVSSHFVLTAAHCLRITDKPHLIMVRIEDGDNMYTGAVKEVETFVMHEKYSVHGKAGQGIAEFYDYDVALIELKEEVKFSPQVRPICIPCTEETNRALKLDDKATCKKHEEMLLKGNVKQALFMDIKTLKFKNVTIKLDKNLMASCLKDVKKVTKIDDATKMVTENFLCTGGIEKVTDNVACKGEPPLCYSGKGVYHSPVKSSTQVNIN